jgi:Icc-related predicted phosphoesterase
MVSVDTWYQSARQTRCTRSLAHELITHHAPSPKSIHPRFADSLLNACFVSDAEHLIDRSRACLWIHGHTHDSFDYFLNGTRVVCNPRGYARNGVNENPLFDANFLVEIN